MKLLVAVDASECSARVIDFVGEVFGSRVPAQLSVTLFHVVEQETDAAGHKQHIVDRTIAEKLLKSLQQKLQQTGLKSDQTETKIALKECLAEAARVTTTLAIIEEMKGGPYDVVVLGRRSASALADSFLGSVAEKVLREARGKTVWVVD